MPAENRRPNPLHPPISSPAQARRPHRRPRNHVLPPDRQHLPPLHAPPPARLRHHPPAHQPHRHRLCHHTGIASTLFSQLSETLGRRPVYLITFSLFVASSVALASIPQGDYAALLTLRMLQSFGSSVSTSIGYAVVADIAPPAERGGILAPVMLMLNLGPVIAPVIGGPMCGSTGWRWIFWFLAMFGSAFLLVMALFLPETNRKIVGNGSIAAKGVSRPPLPFLVPWSGEYEQPVKKTYPTTWAKVRAYAPNPLRSVVLILEKDIACVLFAAGIFYMMYYLSQASLPALFREAYGFSETEIGLCYLALGSGVFFGSQLQLARHVLENTRLKADLL